MLSLYDLAVAIIIFAALAFELDQEYTAYLFLFILPFTPIIVAVLALVGIIRNNLLRYNISCLCLSLVNSSLAIIFLIDSKFGWLLISILGLICKFAMGITTCMLLSHIYGPPKKRRNREHKGYIEFRAMNDGTFDGYLVDDLDD